VRDVEAPCTFSDGAITTLANRSKDFSYYVIDISVAYNEDPDRVAEVLRKTAAELQADPRFGPFILDALEVLGLDAFGDSAMILKVRIKTMPLKQWEVGRELRRRIKKAFDAAGIEIPFPQRVVTTRVEKTNSRTLAPAGLSPTCDLRAALRRRVAPAYHRPEALEIAPPAFAHLSADNAPHGATSAAVAPPDANPVDVFTKSAPAAFDSEQAVIFSSSVSSAASMMTLLIAPHCRHGSTTASMSRSTVRRSPDLSAPMLMTMSISVAPSKMARRAS
jgi:hypothetical protein